MSVVNEERDVCGVKATEGLREGAHTGAKGKKGADAFERGDGEAPGTVGDRVALREALQDGH